MEVNKHIEKPAYVFGVPSNEALVIPLLFIVILILGIAIQNITGLQILGWVMILDFFLAWILFIVLKWASKQRYPGFLFSIIAYKFMQKRKIEPQGFKLKIQKK